MASQVLSRIADAPPGRDSNDSRCRLAGHGNTSESEAQRNEKATCRRCGPEICGGCSGRLGNPPARPTTPPVRRGGVIPVIASFCGRPAFRDLVGRTGADGRGSGDKVIRDRASTYRQIARGMKVGLIESAGKVAMSIRRAGREGEPPHLPRRSEHLLGRTSRRGHRM
jgi:hypothetical protein